ncbi:MAG: hypothetical protein Q4F57_04770 [Weeksellaceae bacterium]|nr:hypothetical protein [Weeksellaceae bacterium]
MCRIISAIMLLLACTCILLAQPIVKEKAFLGYNLSYEGKRLNASSFVNT